MASGGRSEAASRAGVKMGGSLGGETRLVLGLHVFYLSYFIQFIGFYSCNRFYFVIMDYLIFVII